MHVLTLYTQTHTVTPALTGHKEKNSRLQGPVLLLWTTLADFIRMERSLSSSPLALLSHVPPSGISPCDSSVDLVSCSEARVCRDLLHQTLTPPPLILPCSPPPRRRSTESCWAFGFDIVSCCTTVSVVTLSTASAVCPPGLI